MMKDDIYDKMLHMIEFKKAFSFVRYGDGEWGTMFEDTELHSKLIEKWGSSLKQLSKPLLEIVNGDNVRKENYFLGIQNHGYQMFRERIDNLLTNQNTCNSDILHRRNSKGEIDDFFKVLSNTNNLLVGPHYMSQLNLFKFDLVETPQYDVWLHIQDLKDSVNAKLVSGKYHVILYSCSLAAKILIDHFYTLYGDKIIQIDVGSMLDPYCGMYSRNYHINVIKRLGLNESDMMKPKIK